MRERCGFLIEANTDLAARVSFLEKENKKFFEVRGQLEKELGEQHFGRGKAEGEADMLKMTVTTLKDLLVKKK